MSGSKSTGNSPLQQKVKVLAKLYQYGCMTEKELQALTMEAILKIPNITVSDMQIILELQRKIKANKLFSYLGGDENEQAESGKTHHLE